jgi:WD40 repeat protein
MFETKTFAKVQDIHRHGSLNAVCWTKSYGDIHSRHELLIIGGDDKNLAVIKAGNETNTSQQQCHQSLEWVFDEKAFKEVDDNEEASNSPIVKTLSGNVVAIAFSKGSTTRPSPFMAYSTDDNRVTVLSTSDWSLIAEISFPQPATALAFTNGSKYLAYGCLDSRLYVSETYPNWSLVANIELPSPVHSSLIYSHSNRLLGAGLYDGSFKLFDPEHKHAICGSIDMNESPTTTADWSSKAVAIGKEDGTVKLYDPEKLQSGIIEAIATISKRTTIRNVAFGLNGRFLAIGTSDGFVSIYSEKGGWVLCHQLQALKGGVTSLSWCPTSRHLAVGDDRGSVKMMDTVFWADVEEAVHAFHSAEDTIVSSSKPALTFSQNGNLMAFATSNQGLRVADCSRWRLQLCLEHADKDASDVASAENYE